MTYEAEIMYANEEARQQGKSDASAGKPMTYNEDDPQTLYVQHYIEAYMETRGYKRELNLRSGKFYWVEKE